MATERDRLRESEARILALRIAASRPGREAATSYVKDHVTDYVELTPVDLEPAPTRHNEQRWRQIVGNIVSHKHASTSIFNMGYAVRMPGIDGIRVTDKGVEYLQELGY
jgi:hypothetical protein